MAQIVIYVRLEGEFPGFEEVARDVEQRAGIKVPWESVEGQTLVLRPGEEPSSVIEFAPNEKLARVEVGTPPTHFEWIVVASLEHLGGVPCRPVPRFAGKRLGEATLRERMQLKAWFGWDE
ncbi:MAG: hypothetical protein H6953_19585 [Chromatiaceae bacterium]|nr:hypothetical protein [Myxococcales bacterium]MCP5307614.1 hypothetical protein [Chromatiaceae bacterium]